MVLLNGLEFNLGDDDGRRSNLLAFGYRCVSIDGAR